MEDEVIENLDLLVNLETLEQVDIWDDILEENSEFAQELESL